MYRFLLLILFSIVVLGISSCDMTDDRKRVNLALKKDGKTYLFSMMGAFITKHQLANNETPSVMAPIRIVEEDGELYVQVGQIEEIVNLISGNYEVLPYQGQSYDGYVVEAEYDVFDKKYGSQSTKKIGKMVAKVDVHLFDTAGTIDYNISWIRNQNQAPIKNCEEMTLWVDKTYKPGETTFAREDFIMVKLQDIVDFYDSNVTIEYSEEDEILYVIVN